TQKTQKTSRSVVRSISRHVVGKARLWIGWRAPLPASRSRSAFTSRTRGSFAVIFRAGIALVKCRHPARLPRHEDTDMADPLLFTPMALRGITLKNRVVIAPMHQYSAVKGYATDWHLMNAGRFAAGGAGLVIMESTKVERRGCGTVGDLGIWKDEFIPGLKRCAEFIRRHAAVPGIQLGHSGRK